MESVERNIILAFGLILDSRFVQSSALIAGTRRVSPLAQKLHQKGEKPIRYVLPVEQKTNIETIMVYTRHCRKYTEIRS